MCNVIIFRILYLVHTYNLVHSSYFTNLRDLDWRSSRLQTWVDKSQIPELFSPLQEDRPTPSQLTVTAGLGSEVD